MSDEKRIIKLISDKTKLIDDTISTMEKAVDSAQSDLLKAVITDFIDKLETDDKGNIKNTLSNKQKVALLDRIYERYINTSSIQLVSALVGGLDNIIDFNDKYFTLFTKEPGSLFEDTKVTISDWLGITKKGALVENGFLLRLVKDLSIRDEIRNSTFSAIVSKKGYQQVKKDLSLYIEGNKDQAGALQKYYRNYVYDAFSTVDRVQSKIIADKLKLRYVIYEGGIIKTTRPFCRARNGKVFTSEEVEAFDPPTAKQPNYDPWTCVGGYACRHSLNFIPYTVAKSLRPDLPPEK